IVFSPLPPLSTSTPFPYTTLFRSNTSSGPCSPRRAHRLSTSPKRRCSQRKPSASSFSAIHCWQPASSGVTEARRISSQVYSRTRSEEHTSELQSRENLVCRLLLEK